jgi:hypothetical protein
LACGDLFSSSWWVILSVGAGVFKSARKTAGLHRVIVSMTPQPHCENSVIQHGENEKHRWIVFMKLAEKSVYPIPDPQIASLSPKS